MSTPYLMSGTLYCVPNHDEPRPLVRLTPPCPLGLCHYGKEPYATAEDVSLEVQEQMEKCQPLLTAGANIEIDPEDWVISATVPDVPSPVSVHAAAPSPNLGANTSARGTVDIKITSLADIRNYQGNSNIGGYNAFANQVYREVDMLDADGHGVQFLMAHNSTEYPYLYRMFLGGEAEDLPNEFGNYRSFATLPQDSEHAWSDFTPRLLAGTAEHHLWATAKVELADQTQVDLYARLTCEMPTRYSLGQSVMTYNRDANSRPSKVQVWIQYPENKTPVEADITALVGQNVTVTIDTDHRDYVCNLVGFEY